MFKIKMANNNDEDYDGGDGEDGDANYEDGDDM